jgi:hypothetical protein
LARNIDHESPIQISIFDYLQCQYPRALIFSVPNELASKVGGGGKTPAERQRRQNMIRNVQAKAKKMGMLPGMGDIAMLHDWVFYVFEVKAKGNYQQPNQKAVQATTEANGGHYFVVRSIDDVRKAMKSVTLTTDIEHRGAIS